jgi:hypothetical protein
LEVAREDSLCRQCLEAFIAGDKVYCGRGGRFKNLDGIIECEAFNPGTHIGLLQYDHINMTHSNKTDESK